MKNKIDYESVLKPVLESVKKDKQDWQEGLNKIMSKVFTLRESDNQLYLDNPRNLRSSVRKKSSLNFVTDCNTPQLSNKRLRRNLSPGQPGTQPRQGKTTHFDYLVQKDFLEQENSDNRIRANRLQKLNALCAQSSKRIEFLKAQVNTDDYLSRATTQNEAVFSQTSLHRNFKQSLTTKNGGDPETPIDYVNQGIYKLFQNSDVEPIQSTKLLDRNQRVQSAIANGRAQSNDDLRRRIQSAVGQRGERRFKNLMPSPQLTSVQSQNNQDVKLINKCIEKRLQKVNVANLNPDLIKNVVNEALTALQQSRKRPDKTILLYTLGSNLQRVQSDINKSSDQGEKKSLGSNVSFSEKPFSQQTKQSVVKTQGNNEGDAQRSSSSQSGSLNEAKMLVKLKKERLKKIDHPFLKQTKIKTNAEELKPVVRMAYFTRQAPSQDSKNATKLPAKVSAPSSPQRESGKAGGRDLQSPKQTRSIGGGPISINIGGDKANFKLQESLRKNHKPNRHNVDIGIVPEEFENMISYYKKEASEKEGIIKVLEGEENPNFHFMPEKDNKTMFNASGKNMWLNERDYCDKNVLQICKTPLNQTWAQLEVISTEDQLEPVMITRVNNIVAQNFETKLEFGQFGDWFGHGCMITDDFPASLAVKDPRITKPTPNLFQDIKEGEEVAIELLNHQLVKKDNDYIVRRAQDDCDHYGWQKIHIAKKGFLVPMLKEIYQHDIDYSLLEKRLLSEKGTLCNIQDLELQLVQTFKNEAQEQQRELEAITGFQMPVLLQINQITRPDFDFCEVVYTMEEEFVKLEKEIDPVKTGIFDHLEQFNLEKTRHVDSEEMKRLKQFSDTNQINFDIKHVSRTFNREDKMPLMQLLWLLDMDKKLYAAIQNIFYSPFRPAPILQRMMVEFNIFKIHFFTRYLKEIFVENQITRLDYQFQPSRKKFLKQVLFHFNEVFVRRGDQQMKLACYFQKQDYQRQEKLDRLESKHVAFTAERLSRTYEEIQKYKVEFGSARLEEQASESRMQLYIQHDLSSVLLGLTRNRYLKAATYQMLKVMSYAERMGVQSIESDYYEEFGKHKKQEEQFSNPIFQQLRPIQFKFDAQSVSSYFEHQCGFRFLEPHTFFDIFVPTRNKKKQNEVVVVELPLAPTLKKVKTFGEPQFSQHNTINSKKEIKKSKSLPKKTSQQKITDKKIPQKINKNLAEVQLFEARCKR